MPVITKFLHTLPLLSFYRNSVNQRMVSLWTITNGCIRQLGGCGHNGEQPFSYNLNVKLCPCSILLPCLGIEMGQGGRKLYHIKCQPHIPFYFYIHHRLVLHRLATIDNATDRSVIIGSLYSSIVGLQRHD